MRGIAKIPNFIAGLRLVFFGAGDITLTMGVGPDHSIYDLYLDDLLWRSFDGYAASAANTAISISLLDDGPHTLDIRNRLDKNVQSTGNTIRFKSFVTDSGTQQADLQTVTYSYDALSRLLTADSYAGTNLSASTIRHYGYAFDVAGNRTQQTVTVGSGSPTTTNYTYDLANRLLSDGTNSFAYDNAGRMTSDGVNTYTWDRANRLLSMGGSSYQYDGMGRRVQQTVSAQVTQYLLDTQPGLWQVLAATQGANTTRYAHGPMGIQEQQNPDTSWRWPISDGLGSVRGVVDNNVVQQESQLYDPYGSPYGNTGGSQTVFGFTGEPTDGNGLVQLRARYYSPTLGVFTEPDPIEGTMQQPMSLNSYQYAQGNTINMADPSGMYISPTPGQWSAPCEEQAPGCEKYCSGAGIAYGLCMSLCNTEAHLFQEKPTIIDGYLEAASGLTITLATVTAGGATSPGLTGFENVYNFVTFQRMTFSLTITADSAVAASLGGSVYVGAIMGFTPNDASPENFEHFGNQYKGQFNFLSAGAGLGIPFPFRTGVSFTTGASPFASPDYSIIGIDIYFAGSVSAGGLSIGPVSFDLSKGKSFTTPIYSEATSYLKDCQVDIEALTNDIRSGLSGGLPDAYDAILDYRQSGVNAAVWAALAYNLNHTPCHGGMG